MYSKIAESPVASESERWNAAGAPFGSFGASMLNDSARSASTAS